MTTTTRIGLLLGLLAILSNAWAHEFWLFPQRFLLRAGDRIKVQVQVGENFTNEGTTVHRQRIVQFRHYSKGRSIDLIKQVEEGENGGVEIQFQTEGTHLLAYRSNAKFIGLEAAKFNAYLREDGLDNVIEYRRMHGLENKPGRELYSRCVKSLVQVGTFPDSTHRLITRDRLELLPLQNPYATSPGDSMAVRVLFDQKPVSNALVRVWQKTATQVKVDTLRSNNQGLIAFPLRRQGVWMVSAVRMVANPNPQQADWQSFWGNLTFGFE